MTDDRSPLAVALKAYRAAHGLTQVQFAEQRGLDVVLVRSWEGRGKSPTTELARLTAELLMEAIAPTG